MLIASYSLLTVAFGAYDFDQVLVPPAIKLDFGSCRAGDPIGHVRYELVDWKELEALVLPSRAIGAPGCPAPAIFKALLLQQFYALSDPRLEEALADRLSFRHFLGLALIDPYWTTRPCGAFPNN